MTVLANTSIDLLRRIDPFGGINSCWEFIGAKYPAGHGAIRRRKKLVRAHRWSYEHHYDVQLKDIDVVRHLCANPACCNPLHLAIGTQKDNMSDKSKHGNAKNQHTQLTQDELNQMKDLKAQGFSYRQIASRLNRSVWSICYWEKRSFVLPSTTFNGF
jgi:DNA-binding transcriptional regulator YiaG